MTGISREAMARAVDAGVEAALDYHYGTHWRATRNGFWEKFHADRERPFVEKVVAAALSALAAPTGDTR